MLFYFVCEPMTAGERNWKARAQRLKQTRATYRKPFCCGLDFAGELYGQSAILTYCLRAKQMEFQVLEMFSYDVNVVLEISDRIQVVRQTPC